MRQALILVVLLALAGCGVRSVAEQTAPASGPGVFPADLDPRPIVLLGEPTVWSGFGTDTAKLAAGSRRFTLDAELPERPAGSTAITARQAYEELTRDAPPSPEVAPLSITRVELGATEFQTDRGPAVLPAWLFHAEGAVGTIGWPADQPARFWRLGQVHYGAGTAEVSPDGRVLTVLLPAAPIPCPGDQPTRYEPVADETADTVTVSTRLAPDSAPPGDCPRRTKLDLARYEITLAAPLSARLVVDPDGGTVAVDGGP